MDRLLGIIEDWLDSKKFRSAILATGVAFIGVKLGFSTEQVLLIIGPLLTQIGVQGLADLGKGKAIIEGVNTMLKRKNGVTVTTGVSSHETPVTRRQAK